MKIKLISLIILLGLIFILFLKKTPLPEPKQQIIVENNITTTGGEKEDNDKVIKKNIPPIQKEQSFEKNTSDIEDNRSDIVDVEEIDEILKEEQKVVDRVLEKDEKIRIQMIKEQEHLLEMYDLN